MKKYWLVLYPNTFLWVKGNIGLIYNADNHAKVKFINEGRLAEITEMLLDVNNLYRISITEEFITDKHISIWMREVVNWGCGNLIADDGNETKPLSLPPILHIQDDVAYYQWEHRQKIDGNVIQNLHQLIFHINGSQFGNDLYSKQILYPMNTEGALDMGKIRWFASNAKYSSFLSEIILIGNPFLVSGITDTMNELQKICPLTLYVAIQDVAKSLSQTLQLQSYCNLNLLVAPDAISDQFLTVSSHIKDISYTFIVASEQEYETAIKCIEEKKIKDAHITPVYNGNNISFFENYLFIDERTLQDIALSKREVFIRQTLNIFNFGKLFVMPNGNVHSNPNSPVIGTIEESPHSIVYREITEGESWFSIRNKKPCCNCVYQWLCPSPSNYELVIGKPNLCIGNL